MTVDEAGDSRRRTRVLSVGGGVASLERPLNPPLPPRQGHGQIKDEVEARVAELAAAGALDAGNGDVLDAWIETLVPQWHAHQAVDSTEREALSRLNTGRAKAGLAVAKSRAKGAQARLHEAARLYEQVEQRILVRTEAPPGTSERRRRRRPRIDRLEGLVENRRTERFTWTLIVFAVVGDFVTFFMTLADLLRHDVLTTFGLALAFTAASVGLMHAVGTTARKFREGVGGLGRVFITAMVVGWAFLGGSACYIRARVAPVDSAPSDAVFGADPAASASAVDVPFLSAILLAGLFLASGLLAFWAGFSGHHPRMQTYLSLRKDLLALREEVSQAEVAVIAAETELAEAEAEEVRVLTRGEAASGSRQAEIRELMALVRVLIAKHLGSPAATNALTTKRSGKPADDGRSAKSNGVVVGPPRPPMPPMNGNGAVPVPH